MQKTIVVTGGAVRLSNSGLGCPTWPDCQGGSLTPSGPSSYHKVIEFTNRQLTGVLVAIALITAVLAWRQRRELRLAVGDSPAARILQLAGLDQGEL